MKIYKAAFAALVSCLGLGASLWAGEADVLKAQARRSTGGTYQFSVTLRHDDAGWDHYAELRIELPH